MTRARAEYLSAPLVTVDDDLEREFELRVTDCSTLAFRVAFSVVRHRQDAEDVAQEAFVRAHRHFRKLRNRDAFRSWLVRTTWRIALVLAALYALTPVFEQGGYDARMLHAMGLTFLW